MPIKESSAIPRRRRCSLAILQKLYAPFQCGHMFACTVVVRSCPSQGRIERLATII